MIGALVLGLYMRGAQAHDPLVVPAQPLSEVVLYTWQTEHCEKWDVPDAPLRAFRNSENKTVVFVSDSKSRMFIGDRLLSVKHTCHSAYQGKSSPDPSDFSGLDYVTATWTVDGRKVLSLTHNEYHADKFPGMCKFPASMQCWYNAVIGLISSDGGATFVSQNPPQLIAVPNFRQEVDQGHPRGFFNPSNIVYSKGYWYSIIGAGAGGIQQAGMCLFRTKNIEDLQSWSAYGGTEFDSLAIDPYRSNAHAVPCAPLNLAGPVGSISLHTASGLFLAVYPAGPNAEFPVGRIAYQWSADLIHWGASHNLMSMANMSGPDCSVALRYAYPSIADPDSQSRNYDAVGAKPYLFLTRFHTKKCGLPPDRDLIAIPLLITQSQ